MKAPILRICPRIMGYNKQAAQLHQIKALSESSCTSHSPSPAPPSIVAAVSVSVSSRPHRGTDQFDHETPAMGLPMNYILAAAGLLVFGSGLTAYNFNSAVPQHLGIFRDAYCETTNGSEPMLMDNNQFIHASSGLDNVLQSVGEFSDWIRKRIFFMYERRIRAYSSPEKVFIYFASIKDSKEKAFMTPADLMRALIPVFPPSESTTIRSGYLFGERNPGELHCATSTFFMMFDTNSDGRISFEEFNFIRTLLMTSMEGFDATFKMFDRNGDGMIDITEFKKIMQLMRKRNKEEISETGKRLATRKSLDSPQNVKLLKYLFGNDGSKVLQYREFIQFLMDLHDEIMQLEFAHYDCKHQGTIPVQDFGSSLVAAASLSNITKYLRRVDALAVEPRFKGIRISFEDFKQISHLRKKRKLMALSAYAVDEKYGFSKDDFQWATAKVCGVELSDTAVDVIFYLFDNNGDGRLSISEFLGVQHLHDITSFDPLQPGIVRMIRCMWNCAKENCLQP